MAAVLEQIATPVTQTVHWTDRIGHFFLLLIAVMLLAFLAAPLSAILIQSVEGKDGAFVGLEKMIQKRIGKKVLGFGVTAEAANAAEYIRTQGLAVCPVVMHLRAAHRHAGNLGQSATEYEPTGKAAEEARHLYTYTIKLLKQRSVPHGQEESTRARA